MTVRFRSAKLAALAVVSHILYGFEYAVQVRPATTPTKRTKPSLKPWTREDLPRVILIDPADTGRYRTETGSADGSHASPRPHARRAHYRTLRAERFKENRGRRIAIRQAWIGDAQWEHAGQIYKVLPSPIPLIRP